MKISHLKKSYGGKVVLDDISLESSAGQIIALVGNNGSGKTTLMKCIANLIVDYQGNIELDGSLSFAIENPSFYDEFSVQDNLRVFAALMGRKDFNCDKLLHQVSLDEAKNKKFKQLSLGMKQKLNIARILLSNSEIILLDEPFNGLDVLTIKQLKDTILSLRSQGKSLVISSHILDELGEIADIVWYLKKGKIQKIANFNDNLRIYNVIVVNGVDISKLLSNRYEVFCRSKDNKESTFRIKLPREDIAKVLKLLIEHGVQIVEYSDITHDIKDFMLEEDDDEVLYKIRNY